MFLFSSQSWRGTVEQIADSDRVDGLGLSFLRAMQSRRCLSMQADDLITVHR